MKWINETLREMSKINLAQTSDVIHAVNQAHHQSRTRTARSFQAVGTNIHKQISRHSPASL